MSRNHRPAAALAAFLVLAVTVVACGTGGTGATKPSTPARAGSSGGSFPITRTDDEGVKVTFRSAPTRIVTFAPANTEILFALGLSRRIVGVSGPYDNYPPAAKRIDRVGGADGVEPNLERVVALRPDLLLATSGGEDWKKRLRGLGVPVFSVDATSLRDVFHDIDTIGWITGVPGRASALTRTLSARADAIERRAGADRPVSCFYEVYFQPPVYTVGPGSFVFDLLKHAGCVPVTSGLHRQYPELSVEAVVHDDPRVYLVDSLSASSLAAVAKRPGFDALSAVRGHRVDVINSDLVTRPGPRVVQGLRALAVALHPDAFR
jgi:iron complex transport system substrate-binding protein